VVHARIRASVDQESQREKRFQKKKEEQQRIDDIQKPPADMDFKKHPDSIFKVSDTLLHKLTPIDLYRLSELQLLLEQCRSEFAVAYNVGNSEFFKRLSDNRKKELRVENEKLFELINLEAKFKEEPDDS
jgi:hypothetical protein